MLMAEESEKEQERMFPAVSRWFAGVAPGSWWMVRLDRLGMGYRRLGRR